MGVAVPGGWEPGGAPAGQTEEGGCGTAADAPVAVPFSAVGCRARAGREA